MSSINSISGSGSSSSIQPPDPSKMVDKLFSKLDPTGKGYITKSDLQTAMDQMSASGSSSGTGSSNGTSSSSSSAIVDEIFKKIDTNGDGKITKDEMTSGMKSLASSLQGQINKTGRGGPPSGGSSQSSSSSDSTSSTQSSSATKTYQAADTNQDGKVSEKEQIAYDLLMQSQASSTSSNASKAASSTSSNSGNAASATSNGSDARIMKQIVDLMNAYSSSNSSSSNSGISVTA